jgi:hypothetical protein
MQKLGIHVQRESFKSRIKKICDAYGVRRDSIGLVTGARAAVYFNGEWLSVSFDAIEDLAGKGTDVVFIEKEGIIEELKEFADKYGVAMVNSRGYLTEYAQDLMRAADAAGGNVIIISDYDLSGINLSSKCPKNITWITMDDATLQYFGLKKDDNIVVDATHKDLIDSVTKLKNTDARFMNLDIEFLKTSRIEINAIIAIVGEERFWEFIMYKLKELFPTRNLNRAIELPTKDPDLDEIDLYPNGIRSLMLRVRKVRDDAAAKKEKEIESSQEKVEGFLDVSEKKKENIAAVKKAVAENKDIKELEAEAVEVCNRKGIEIEEPQDAKNIEEEGQPSKTDRKSS